MRTFLTPQEQGLKAQRRAGAKFINKEGKKTGRIFSLLPRIPLEKYGTMLHELG